MWREHLQKQIKCLRHNNVTLREEARRVMQEERSTLLERERQETTIERLESKLGKTRWNNLRLRSLLQNNIMLTPKL